MRAHRTDSLLACAIAKQIAVFEGHHAPEPSCGRGGCMQHGKLTEAVRV